MHLCVAGTGRDLSIRVVHTTGNTMKRHNRDHNNLLIASSIPEISDRPLNLPIRG